MKRTRHLTLQALSLVMIGLLSMPTGAIAQANAGLVIQVLESNQGENLTEKEMPPMKVRVMDRTGRVIPGADVSFRAPDEGPTGHFVSNNASQITVTTDSRGTATAPPFRTNTRVGDYQINVVASYRDSISKAVIPQSNVYKVKSSSNKKFIILSVVIGGAAAATLATKRGGGSGPSALDALAVTPTLTIGSSVGVAAPNPVLLPASDSVLTITATDAVSAPAAAPATTTTAPTTTFNSTPVTIAPSPVVTQPIATTPSAPSSGCGVLNKKNCGKKSED